MNITNCILTGIPVTENGDSQMTITDEHYVYWYGMQIFGKRVPISICRGLAERYDYAEELKKIEENRLILVGHFLNDIENNFKYKVFHWKCDLKGKKDHINLSELIEELNNKTNYPKTRKEKYDNLIKWLHNSQTFEGSKLQLTNSIETFGVLYFQSFGEMQFFLRELQRKQLIEYNEIENSVQFTFYGLEYIDTLKKSVDFDMNIFSKPSYQIGLSFAGEDRAYVDEVANELTEQGISVFYDNYEQVDLWGKDLYQHLNDVYKNKCEYCIIFVSESYAKKMWTMHELKSAQTKAFTENKEYILPARFDNTELPGINSTVAYIDCNVSVRVSTYC
jgi:TIR domain